MFVQARSQIYLYDCEPILQNQYQSWAPAQLRDRGCTFVKKLLPKNQGAKGVVNFKAVKNTLMVYFEDGSIDIMYTRDLLQYLQTPTRFKSPKDLPILEHIEPGNGDLKNRYETVA